MKLIINWELYYYGINQSWLHLKLLTSQTDISGPSSDKSLLVKHLLLNALKYLILMSTLKDRYFV